MHPNHPIKKIKLSGTALFRIKNYRDFFLDHLGLKKGEIIYQINGVKIKTRAHTIDKSIFAEVALGDIYSPKWLRLKEDATIIDVGAHIGIFSIIAASKARKGLVYAIEPSKENYSILLDQIKMNNVNIKPFNIALSDKNGAMNLYSGKHSARGSLLRKEGGTSEIVETVTLNNFFKTNKISRCDLMKMDIEGGEYAVLYSTPKRIFDKIDRVFIEIHKIEGENRIALITFLENMGFLTKFKEEDFVYAYKRLV